jgi:hypothetical protein
MMSLNLPVYLPLISYGLFFTSSSCGTQLTNRLLHGSHRTSLRSAANETFRAADDLWFVSKIFDLAPQPVVWAPTSAMS